MPAAAVLALADAVVAALNVTGLSQSFTAVRSYVPVHKAEDMETLEVTVVARELSLASQSRGSDDFTYAVDVGVQKRVGTGNLSAAEILAATDPLVLLCEEILDRFRGQNLTGAAGEDFKYAGAACPLVYSPEHMDQHRVFTSVLTLTYRQARART